MRPIHESEAGKMELDDDVVKFDCSNATRNSPFSRTGSMCDTGLKSFV